MLLHFSHHSLLSCSVSNWKSTKFLSNNSFKTQFFIFSLPQQLSYLNTTPIHLPGNIILWPVSSGRYLGVIFNWNCSCAQHNSAVSKLCFHNIGALRRIHNTNDHTTACTIIRPSFTLKLTSEPLFNLFCLQLKDLSSTVTKSAVRAVTKTIKFHHNNPIIEFLNGLKINEKKSSSRFSLSLSLSLMTDQSTSLPPLSS